MLSDTHYTVLNVWLFKNDKFAVLVLVIVSSNDILYLKMEDALLETGWTSEPLRGEGPVPDPL